MAYLLGSQYCIESLKTDVSDLQTAVTDVCSRTGPVVHPSWKYPDKSASEIDVVELLDIHNFTNDEESNQVAHIILLELVVDRLVLLLQAMARFMEQVLATASRKVTAVHSTSNTSIGLVVKKYWNKMIQINTVVQQLQSEAKTKSRKIEEQEERMQKIEEELQQCKTGVGCPSYSSFGGAESSLSSISRATIARDESSRPSQTIETAFVPCEACYRVQRCLKEVGIVMNTICESQELPCSLAKYQAQVENMDWMSSNEVGHWCAEQVKDLTRINKHFEHLVSTIDPLKKELADQIKANKEVEAKLSHTTKEVKSEKNTQAIMQKQFQSKLKEAERQHNLSVKEAQKQKEEHEKRNRQLGEEIEALRSELEHQNLILCRTETEKHQLQDELRQQNIARDQIVTLENEMRDKNKTLAEVQKKLRETERDLAKEKARSRSLSMHSESVQGKQGSMLQRIDEMDRANEKLMEEISELEEIKDQLEERIDREEERKREVEREYKEQTVKNARLVKEKETLEQSVQDQNDTIESLEKQLSQAKENEKLLIMYPDLNGPVNSQLNGTGDIALDMENQVKANMRRIMALEEQNATLRKSITKVIETQSRAPKEMLSRPVPLWRPQDTQEDFSQIEDLQSECVHVEPEHRTIPENSSINPLPGKQTREHVRESFTIGKSPVVNTTKKKSRPPSGQSSSIHAYLRLKNAGLLKPNRAPPVKLKDSDYVSEDVFSCKGKTASEKTDCRGQPNYFHLYQM